MGPHFRGPPPADPAISIETNKFFRDEGETKGRGKTRRKEGAGLDSRLRDGTRHRGVYECRGGGDGVTPPRNGS